jgi:hypothetical protein
LGKSGGGGTQVRAGVIEKKMAIYLRALEHNPNDMDLLLGYLRQGQVVWEYVHTRCLTVSHTLTLSVSVSVSVCRTVHKRWCRFGRRCCNRDASTIRCGTCTLHSANATFRASQCRPWCRSIPRQWSSCNTAKTNVQLVCATYPIQPTGVLFGRPIDWLVGCVTRFDGNQHSRSSIRRAVDPTGYVLQ